MTIRPLGSWEEEDILPIARQFYEESQVSTGTTVGGFSDERCLMNWRSFPLRHAVGLWEDGELVGVLAGFIAPQFMTGEPLAQEMFWYVKKEHRGALASIRMFEAFENWAAQCGCYGIMMASLSHAPGVEALYKRRGYLHIESHHLKIF